MKVSAPCWLLAREQWQHVAAFMRHPRLSVALLTCIGLLVAQGSECAYCVDLEVLLVSVASLRAGLPNDPTCILYPGEHSLRLMGVQKGRTPGAEAG